MNLFLQGVNKKIANAKIDQMLEDIQLMDKKNARAATLSGGMKRKLRLGVIENLRPSHSYSNCFLYWWAATIFGLPQLMGYTTDGLPQLLGCQNLLYSSLTSPVGEDLAS